MPARAGPGSSRSERAPVCLGVSVTNQEQLLQVLSRVVVAGLGYRLRVPAGFWLCERQTPTGRQAQSPPGDNYGPHL